MWYLRACRACLTTTGSLEKIGAKAKLLFAAITSLQIAEDDGFPQYFCTECLAQLKKAVAFRRRSRRAHFVLKEIHLIKKQVSQKDIEKVDRKKTNLTSPYTSWDPGSATAFSYTCLDAIENLPEEGITPELQEALKQSLVEEKKRQFQYDFNVKHKGQVLNLEILPIQNTRKFHSEIFSTNGEFVKHQLDVVKSSAILVDIKPGDYEEIVKEEEEKRRLERQKEIELALREIAEENQNDDVEAENEVEVPAPEIDLEDVFKDLKEESVKESESEEEPLPPAILEVKPVKPEKPKAVAKWKSQCKNLVNNYIDHYNHLMTLICQFSKQKALICGKRTDKKPQQSHLFTAETLSETKIRLLSYDEQVEQFIARMNQEPFCSALYKCAMCLSVHGSMQELYSHVEYHNSKERLEHACPVCKDRFKESEELTIHCANTHWYAYSCAVCCDTHYTIADLVQCASKKGPARKPRSWMEELKYFKLSRLHQHEMASTLTNWSGDVRGRHKCKQCKISFGTQALLNCHMEGHLYQPANRNRPYQCDACKLYLGTFKAMEQHVTEWHLYRYKCKLCRSSLYNKVQARRHFKGHVQKWCIACNQYFKTVPQFVNHVTHAHNLRCALCDQSYATKTKLYTHQLFVHGYIKPAMDVDSAAPAERIAPQYKCDRCILYFANEREYYSHLAKEKHQELNNYDCREWVKAVGKEDLVHLPIEKLNQLKRVCENHFQKGDFRRTTGRLRQKAIPSRNLLLPPLLNKQLVGFPLHVASYVAGQPSKSNRPDKVIPPAQPAKLDSVQPRLPNKSRQKDASKTKNQKRPMKKKQPSASNHKGAIPRKRKLLRQLHEIVKASTECTVASVNNSTKLKDSLESTVLEEIIDSALNDQKLKLQRKRSGCRNCKILFKTVDEYSDHLGKCPNRKYPRKCFHCDETLPNFYEFRVHLNRMHKDKPDYGGPKELCFACGKMVYYLQAHMKIHDRDVFPCKFCDQKSLSPVAQISHVLFNHTHNPYCCITCGARFMYRSNCRDHILKHHAPVRPYACASCARQFAHLDYLSEHCRKAHGVDLKQGDRSVYLPKRMFGKVYVYPHMKIDGSLIEKHILEQAQIEICDYMDENNSPIHYDQAFFFDPTVDPAAPTSYHKPKTRHKATNKKLDKQRQRKKRHVEMIKLQKIQERMRTEEEVIMQEDNIANGDDKCDFNFESSIDETETRFDIKETFLPQFNLKDSASESNVVVTSEEIIEPFTDESGVQEAMEIEYGDDVVPCDDKSVKQDFILEQPQQETEDVLGQLIEQDGEMYVLVNDTLYKLENDTQT